MTKKYKIIIFGCNSLSAAVAEQLKERSWELLLVARETQCIEAMAARGFDTLSVDYTDDDELRALGIGESVEIIFTFFEDDAQNVFLTISAKDIDPQLKVISLTQSGDSSHKLLAAGATKVVDPYEISGRKIYDMLKRPLIAETIESVVFGQDYLNLAQVAIEEGAFMDGKRLGELALSHHYDLVVLGAIDRELSDEFIFACSGTDHKLDQGDVLVVIGQADAINRLKQDALQSTAEP
ncbi:MAG: NAD-binding protein [Candidatus Sedimenticola sp. (ex Thyasira tokunagai)]